MRRGRGLADLQAERDRAGHRQRPFPAQLRERLAVEVLEDEVVDALVLADGEERADICLPQPRDRLRLAVDARAEVGILRQRRRQDLDRDVRPSRVSRAL